MAEVRTSKLRFVVRSGQKVLQQEFVFTDDVTFEVVDQEWRDVPTETE